jgi:hypothetical protein
LRLAHKPRFSVSFLKDCDIFADDWERQDDEDEEEDLPWLEDEEDG